MSDPRNTLSHVLLSLGTLALALGALLFVIILIAIPDSSSAMTGFNISLVLLFACGAVLLSVGAVLRIGNRQKPDTGT